jgi:hypothetical protein
MKKIVIQTVYHNCTDEFVEEYLKSLSHNKVLKQARKDFLNGEVVGFRSDDDKSPAYGITTYQLLDGGDREQ